MRFDVKLGFLVLFVCFNGLIQTGSSETFNVLKFGAKGNGKTDDTKAFMDAWKAACGSNGTVKLLIPQTNYLIGPIKFLGPCKGVSSLSIQLQGTLRASTDLNKYGSSADWVEFGWIDGLTLTGGGTFDGQGAAAWPRAQCPKNKNCKVLPTSIKFVTMTNTIVKGLKSVDSKFFHIGIVGCTKFHASNLQITAPEDSPNTDGIHIEKSSDVMISQSTIGTGDDCISIGQGNSDVTISGITCGPGHGISVGSLGRYKDEGDVRGLVVRDCTIIGTMNGVRIKTWPNSPGSSVAANMTFDNIVMKNVGNPIIIDQTYCPFANCASVKNMQSGTPSRVKISDISFKNIRGTSSTPVGVTLHCSRGNPCQNVKLHNVHLNSAGGRAALKSTCQFVHAKYSGTQIPPPCA